MPITSFQTEVQTFLRYGWDQVTKVHPEQIDEIFAKFKDDHLWKQYGDWQIHDIKEWLAGNEVKIKNAYQLQPTDIPCISIALANGNEQSDKAFFSDLAGTEEIEGTERIIVKENVPASYDPLTNTIRTQNDVSVELVQPNHVVIDSGGSSFLITRVIDNNTLQIEVPTAGPTPQLSKMSIWSTRKKVSFRGEAYMTEFVDIGIHSLADQNILIWMYFIVVYILFRYKTVLQQRCMDLHTFSVSDFARKNEMLGNHVYSRNIRMSARIRLSWLTDPMPQPDTLFSELQVPTGDTATVVSGPNPDIIEGVEVETFPDDFIIMGGDENTG